MKNTMSKIAIIIIMMGSASFISCNKTVGPTGDGDKIDLKNVVSTREYTIPIQQGKVSVVYAGDEIVAAADEPMTILLPKECVTRASSGTVRVEYLSEEDFNELGIGLGTMKLFQVVAFEDSRKGDYDYNDLVIHVRYDSRNSNWEKGKRVLAVGIHPVALGSTKKIALGYDVYYGDELVYSEMVTDDCRRNLFQGREGMLNTLTKNFEANGEYAYINKSIFYPKGGGKAVSVNWFIVVDGNTRLNAVSTVYTANMVDAGNRPYGIVVTNTGYHYNEPGIGIAGKDWFNYPLETVNIDQVYPDFGRWLKGEYTGTFSSMYRDDSKKSFDAVGQGVYMIDNSSAPRTLFDY